MIRARIRMLVVAGLVVVPALASAQGSAGARRVKVGVAAGATVPLGDFGDFVKTGYHVGGLIDYDMMASPLSLRGEVTWHRNDIKDEIAELTGDDNTTILGVVGNVLYRFGMQAEGSMVPYIIGGVGYYHLKSGDSDAEDKFGLNGGVGLRIPLSGFSTNIEARYHSVFTDESNTNFLPLSVSITF